MRSIKISILFCLFFISRIALSQYIWNLPFSVVNNPGYKPPAGSFNSVYDITHSFTDSKVLLRVPTDFSEWHLDHLSTVTDQFRVMESVGGPQVFGIARIPAGSINSNAPFGILIEKIEGYKEYKVPDDYLTRRPGGLTDAEYRALQKYGADLEAKGLTHNDMQGFFVEENQFGGGKTTRFRPIDPDFLNDNKNTFGGNFVFRRPGQTPTWKGGITGNSPTSQRPGPGGGYCPPTSPKLPPYVPSKMSSIARATARQAMGATRFVVGSAVRGAMPTTGGGSRMTGGIGAMGLMSLGFQAAELYDLAKSYEAAADPNSIQNQMMVMQIWMDIIQREKEEKFQLEVEAAALRAFGNTFNIPMFDLVDEAYYRSSYATPKMPSRAQFISGSP